MLVPTLAVEFSDDDGARERETCKEENGTRALGS